VVNNPTDLPELDHVEDFIKATITKADFVGNVIMYRKRGLITNQTYLTTERVELTLTCLKLYLIFMTV
jgi:GTP-binding protein LepA